MPGGAAGPARAAVHCHPPEPVGGQYAPTGLSSNRLKGVHILDHYVSMDEYDQNRDAR